MIALEKARRIIREAPEAEDSRVLQQLLHALENDSPFPLGAIYEIDYTTFELCLELIAGWRLHRHRGGLRKVPRSKRSASAQHDQQDPGGSSLTTAS